MVRARRSMLTALCLGLAGTLAVIGAGRADLVPGGGPAKSDCYGELDEPRTDEDQIVLKCLPRTTPCPTATGADAQP